MWRWEIMLGSDVPEHASRGPTVHDVELDSEYHVRIRGEEFVVESRAWEHQKLFHLIVDDPGVSFISLGPIRAINKYEAVRLARLRLVNNRLRGERVRALEVIDA